MAASIPAANVDTIIFACEAGIGSSIMGVNAHKPVREVPATAKVVVAHKGLATMARQKAPNAVVISFVQFLNDPVFDKIVNALKAGDDLVEA